MSCTCTVCFDLGVSSATKELIKEKQHLERGSKIFQKIRLKSILDQIFFIWYPPHVGKDPLIMLVMHGVVATPLVMLAVP